MKDSIFFFYLSGASVGQYMICDCGSTRRSEVSGTAMPNDLWLCPYIPTDTIQENSAENFVINALHSKWYTQKQMGQHQSSTYVS